MLFFECRDFLLTLLVLGIALLHVFVDAFEPLLVLGHARAQVVLNLELLVKHCVVVDLSYLFPLVAELLLNIDDQTVSEPHAVEVLLLEQRVADVVAPHSAEDFRDLVFVDAQPLLLDDLHRRLEVFVFRAEGSDLPLSKVQLLESLVQLGLHRVHRCLCFL